MKIFYQNDKSESLNINTFYFMDLQGFIYTLLRGNSVNPYRGQLRINQLLTCEHMQGARELGEEAAGAARQVASIPPQSAVRAQLKMSVKSSSRLQQPTKLQVNDGSPCQEPLLPAP